MRSLAKVDNIDSMKAVLYFRCGSLLELRLLCLAMQVWARMQLWTPTVLPLFKVLAAL
jgi:hypothetical protein